MEPQNKSESILSRLSQQLTALEKRDFELLVIVVGTCILAGAAFVAILFPGAKRCQVSGARESFQH